MENLVRVACAKVLCQEPSILFPMQRALLIAIELCTAYIHSFQDDGIMSGYLSRLWHQIDGCNPGGLPEVHNTQS
jgi:hypothetical protein